MESDSASNWSGRAWRNPAARHQVQQRISCSVVNAVKLVKLKFFSHLVANLENSTRVNSGCAMCIRVHGLCHVWSGARAQSQLKLGVESN